MSEIFIGKIQDQKRGVNVTGIGCNLKFQVCDNKLYFKDGEYYRIYYFKEYGLRNLQGNEKNILGQVMADLCLSKVRQAMPFGKDIDGRIEAECSDYGVTCYYRAKNGNYPQNDW